MPQDRAQKDMLAVWKRCRADAGTALLAGKVCLLTGGSRGIGRVVAQQLAGLGAEPILLVRSEQSGEKVRSNIQEGAGREVRLLVCDLASQASIRAAAQRLFGMVDRVDALVNNAATIPRRRELTPDGLETQLAVNHLGGFMLTNLLLPLLKAAPAARVVNVASNAHSGGRLDFDDLQAARRYHKQGRYKATKLANVLFTYALARRLEGSRVTVNAVRPGTINTGLIGAYLWPLGFLRWLFATSPPSRGAAPIVRAVADPALAGISGRYFDRFEDRASSPSSRDEALQERLWEVSSVLTGLPGSEP